MVSRFQGFYGIKVFIDSRLGEIFTVIHEKAFTGLSVVTVADLLQLPPVRGKLIFSHSMKHLLGLQLWHLFT